MEVTGFGDCKTTADEKLHVFQALWCRDLTPLLLPLLKWALQCNLLVSVLESSSQSHNGINVLFALQPWAAVILVALAYIWFTQYENILYSTDVQRVLPAEISQLVGVFIVIVNSNYHHCHHHHHHFYVSAIKQIQINLLFRWDKYLSSSALLSIQKRVQSKVYLRLFMCQFQFSSTLKHWKRCLGSGRSERRGCFHYGTYITFIFLFRHLAQYQVLWGFF